MRKLLGIFLPLAVALVGPDAQAQNDPVDDLFQAPVAKPQPDPFTQILKEEEEKQEKARMAPVLQATLVYEIFELEQADWLSWTGKLENSIEGPELRNHVQQLLEKGGVSLAQLALLRCSPQVRAKSESIDEILYQTEYDPEGPQSFEEMQAWNQLDPDFFKPPTKFTIGVLDPGKFETRNAGVTLEMDPGIERETGAWWMGTNPEWVRQNGAKILGHGLGEVEIPIFNAQRFTQTSTNFEPGKIRFMGSTRTPESKVNLHFYRLDAHELKEPVVVADVRKFRGEPKSLSIVLEWIEMEQVDFRKCLNSVGLELGGDQLRLEIAKLIESENARILETTAAPLELEKRLKIEAIDEMIYPSEYDPPEFTEEGEIVFLEPAPAAMETRNLGFSVEVDPDPDRGPSARGLDLNLNYSHVSLNRQLLWGPPEWKLEMPEFHTVNSIQSLWLPFGARQLLSSFELTRDPESPFEDPRVLVFGRVNARDWTPAEPEDEKEKFTPTQLGFVFEIFETTQAKLDQLLAFEKISTAGPELRDRLADAADAVETIAHITRSGQSSKVESIDEYIYPGEYDPGYLILENKIVVAPNPAAFETRNLGLTFEFDAVLGDRGHIDLAFNGEFVQLTGLREHFKGEAAMKTPDIRTQRLTQSVKLTPGMAALLGTTRPLADPENPDAIRVWFVHGDVLKIPNEKS